MSFVFVHGILCHPPLLREVLGTDPPVVNARLPGHALLHDGDDGVPAPYPSTGRNAEGLLFDCADDEVLVRLVHFLSAFGQVPRPAHVRRGDGDEVEATAFFPQDGGRADRPWDPAGWDEGLREVATEAGRDVMALRGQRDGSEIGARYGQMLVRAASRLRAAAGAPVTLRRQSGEGDVAVETWCQPYARFFAVEELDLRFRRFDGSMSDPVNRAVFVTGDAATVLPYDPVRDRVLVIEQFRPGPFVRGDRQPWLIEPIAGRIDPGESAEEAIRREAVEEAGLQLKALHPIASYYPSPAGKSEYIFSFIGIADLPEEGTGAVAGVAGEAEDIRPHVIGFDRLMQLVESGEADNGPLLLSALFLARNRDRLRAAA
jgi:ADP-ribose pyrophosphatase